jgi:primosomal protein N' (replication factor Y)
MSAARASVAVPRPVRRLFTYLVPPGLEPRCRPGVRVLVPFGRRQLTGYVVDLLPAAADGEEPFRLRPIDRVLDDDPPIDARLFEVTRWAAEYYVAPWGEVLRAAIPGPQADVRRTLAITEAGRRAIGAATPAAEGDLVPGVARHPAAQAILADLLRRPAGATLVDLRRRVGPAWNAAMPARLAQAGLVAFDDVLAAGRPRRAGIEVVTRVAGTDPGRGARRRALVTALEEAGGTLPAADLLDRAGATRAVLQALVKRGVVRIETREPEAAPGAAASGVATAGVAAVEPGPDPTPAQAWAIAAVEEALGRGGHATFLLHGVTGSGKTEVYLRSIASVVARGGRALYLVPEIGLTPLLARRLRARLGGGLAVVHSRIGERERAETWRRIRDGRVSVVLGARSAVFAPIPDLGLIVVDEEHDASYKQEETPRYHGRDLAILRASRAGIPALLGSATPSVESYFQAQRGKYRLLELPERVGAPGLPPVERVDMRAEFRDQGRESVLSRRLEQGIADRLDRGEQCILLLNRRGFSTFAVCRACGATIDCRRCSIALTLHLRDRRLVCHYCDASRAVPEACPECRSPHLHYGGTGTERLEQVLRGRFPDARLERMDRDTVRGRGAAEAILTRVESGAVDILFGTQMIAKGHDFPNVTLVGVLAADAPLGLPDFRAGERTFQLLAQVAGRSGRGPAGGEVILQAWDPDHHAIRTAANHDYAGFAAQELAFRRIARYPPYCALATVLVKDRQLERAREIAARVAAAIRAIAAADTQVLGPALAPLERLRGLYRVQVIVKTGGRRRMQELMAALLGDLERRGERVEDLAIDVDPVSTL